MKNDIIIRNRGGLLAVVANIAGTFQLRGPKDALDIVQEAAPVLEAGDNPMEVLGDCLTRMAAMGAKDQAPRPNPLVSHEEMQKRTLLDRPIVLFQIRGQFADMLETLRNVMEESHDEAAANTAKSLIDDIEETGWITERVFIDDQEATDYVAVQRHRYPEEDENEAWRFYAVSAERSLHQAIRDARDISNL